MLCLKNFNVDALLHLKRPANRYTFISFGYAIGTQILGGPVAPLFLCLYKQTHVVWIAACYWVILATAVGIYLIIDKRYIENHV